MPLMPPARRSWDDHQIELKAGNTTVKWPPTGRKVLIADQKLLQWDYVAMRLEEQIHSTRYTSITRQILLNKCNMLAVPGTPNLNHSVDDEEHWFARKAKQLAILPLPGRSSSTSAICWLYHEHPILTILLMTRKIGVQGNLTYTKPCY